MATPFVHAYMQVGVSADEPTNPVTDTDFMCNPEILILRYNTDTGKLRLFDPEAEAWIDIN